MEKGHGQAEQVDGYADGRGVARAGIDRRQFMMRAGVAGVAGAVAWTAPQIFSASPASAAVGSAPPAPQPGGPNTPNTPNNEVLATVDRKLAPTAPANATVLAQTVPKSSAAPSKGPAALAATGTNAKLMAEWAAGLLAAGTAMVVAGREHETEPQPVDNGGAGLADPPPAD